ncbi:MAG TPA: hypothetical protein VNW99_12515 [Cytophagaceae bacterium]|jgi:hypothetical protein|nr:hypothetical protein [Cytophagaceae bacterium]
MHPFIKEIESIPSSAFRFSICTMVTDKAEYEEMVDSFLKAGFDQASCEYLYIDNSIENKYDAYEGLNRFLSIAAGKYIILCHQDILLNHDNRSKLEQCIEDANQKFPDWALLGNAGGISIKRNASKIVSADGKIHQEEKLPAEVKSLDENFILIKKAANLGLSHDLNGYHLYGTDLCLIAGVIGYKAYVIDFLLTHKSFGNPGKDFYSLKNAFIRKYKGAFGGKFIRTTITKVFIGGSSFKSIIYNSKTVFKLISLYHKILSKPSR